MTEPSEDIPQPPEYDGPDWDETDVPVAQCGARTPAIQEEMNSWYTIHPHVIQEGPADARS